MNEGLTAPLDGKAQSVGRLAGSDHSGRRLVFVAKRLTELPLDSIVDGAAHDAVHGVLDLFKRAEPMIPDNECDVDCGGRRALLSEKAFCRRV
jgi:hypothetical protein